MFCTKCGKENKDTSKFCKACGAPLEPIDSVIEETPVPNEPIKDENQKVIDENDGERKAIHSKVKVKVKSKVDTPNDEKDAEQKKQITEEKKPKVIEYKQVDIFAKRAAEEEIIVEFSEEDKVKTDKLLREAHCLQRGVACPVDVPQAYELYKSVFSIDADNTEALNCICKICFDGDIDSDFAFDCANKSAQKQNATGMFWLASFYAEGFGCQENIAEAVNWFKKSTERKNIRSAVTLCDYIDNNEYQRYMASLTESGNLVAAVALFEYYMYGENTNEERALFYLNQAVDNNYPDAIALYANVLEFGSETIQADLPKSKQLWEKAAALEDEQALFRMGSFYWHGEKGYPEDYDIAQRYYEKVIDKGDLYYASAASDLGILLCEKGTDDKRAVSLLTEAALDGNAVANSQLGSIYNLGTYGVETDLDMSIKYYERAADLGLESAMYTLGYTYLNGADGRMPIDTSKGIEWLSRAAKNEHGPAAEEVGDYYYNGQFVDKDLKKARHYYELAAKEGMAKSMLALGIMNEEGEGGPKLFKAAEYWYKRLDESGADNSCIGKCNLGRIYLYKMGRYSEALPLFIESAQAGNSEAMYYAGICYGNGWGTPVILKTAETYLNYALQNGMSEAQNDLTTIRNLLVSGEQIPQTTYPPKYEDDSRSVEPPTPNFYDSIKSFFASIFKRRKTGIPNPNVSKTKKHYYKDPGMDVKQAGKIIGFTVAFFVIGMFMSLVVNAATGSLNFGVAILISYAVSALPLSIMRLKGLRANDNKAEYGAIGGYLVGGGSQGNGCTIASAFIIGRWLINWIICLFAILYWFPKSIIALVRNSNNKKVGG